MIEGERSDLCPCSGEKKKKQKTDVFVSQQEDFYAFATLALDPEELRISVKKAHGIEWDPWKVGDAFAGQVVFVGIYDGSVPV